MSDSPSPEPAKDVPVGANGIRVNVTERAAFSTGAALPLLGCAVLAGLSALSFIEGARTISPPLVVLGVLLALLALLVPTTLQTLSPGETHVVQFFGRYVGTVRRDGFTWRLPLTSAIDVLVRVRNFETNSLKVNDRNGSPIMISAVVVWQVADTARATFAVSDYENFIHTQAEAALRHVASAHPYDDSGNEADESVTLRGNSSVITVELANELAERISLAGLEVIEVRLSNLSYAPEIAGAMLQRQQAQALVDARRKIVQGAVGMTADAIRELEVQIDGVSLDPQQRAAMTSNLMTVIVGGSHVQPVVNTGTV